MLYVKPKNLKYTDMCIYIDTHVYKEDITEQEQEKIYEYLYHITKMLAYKSRFFEKSQYYEEFAIYSATRTYLRLTNPKQFMLDENGQPKMTKLKSVLNYIKAILYPHKVDFEQEFYAQTIQPAEQEEIVVESPYSFADRIHESTDKLNIVEFASCLNDICKTAKNFLSKIPYKINSKEWQNIYLSCLLTFLNTITLSNAEKSKVENFRTSYEYKLKYTRKVYKQQSLDAPILYHLDDSMSNYIRVLTIELKHAIAQDLSLLTHTYVPSTSGVNRLMLADINGIELDEYDKA